MAKAAGTSGRASLGLGVARASSGPDQRLIGFLRNPISLSSDQVPRAPFLPKYDSTYTIVLIYFRQVRSSRGFGVASLLSLVWWECGWRCLGGGGSGSAPFPPPPPNDAQP